MTTCSKCEGLHAALVSIATCPECDRLMACSEDCRFAANALADGDTTACAMRDLARAALADADVQVIGGTPSAQVAGSTGHVCRVSHMSDPPRCLDCGAEWQQA
jgi:hypothetical protein